MFCESCPLIFNFSYVKSDKDIKDTWVKHDKPTVKFKFVPETSYELF